MTLIQKNTLAWVIVGALVWGMLLGKHVGQRGADRWYKSHFCLVALDDCGKFMHGAGTTDMVLKLLSDKARTQKGFLEIVADLGDARNICVRMNNVDLDDGKIGDREVCDPELSYAATRMLLWIQEK
jgi:hypothetical protein